MSDSVNLTFRGIVIEDLMLSTTLATTAATVLGAGTVTVTPFVSAVSDAGAGAAGVPVGGVYVNTSGSVYYLATRLT
jgi:hypothetical protein